MQFRTLPPDVARRAIAGIPNIIAPAVAERDYTIKRHTCPRCAGDLQTRFHPNHIYEAGEILPRSVGTCGDCGYTIDPESNLVLDLGDPTKAAAT